MKNLQTNKQIIATLLLFAATTLSQTASANSNSPVIDTKQKNQKDRIIQGVNSGELTGREAWRLGKQQGRIYHKENRFKSDGNFTKRERAIIHRDLQKSSKRIYGQKHDRQTRGAVRTGTRHVTRPAGLRSPGINKRQMNQKRRVGQGIRSGELTGREAARLGHQQARIHRQERRFKSDGRFTKRERAIVHKNQNRASKNIYRKKHNNRSR